MWPIRCAVLATFTMRAAGSGQQLLQHETGEREVAEVVDRELQLEAVGGEGARHRHHTGVVAEDVELRRAVADAPRGPPHAREIGEVDFEKRDPCRRRLGQDARHGLVRLARVATAQEDLGPALREHARSVKANTAIGTRDEDGLVGQVGHVVGDPGRRRHGYEGAMGRRAYHVLGVGRAQTRPAWPVRASGLREGQDRRRACGITRGFSARWTSRRSRG